MPTARELRPPSDDDEQNGSFVDIETQRRIELNEQRFREMNDQQLAAGEDFHGEPAVAMMSIMCECATLGCEASVNVSPVVYREVRTHPSQYLVLPDHVIPSVERIERDCTSYWVVAKFEMGVEVAPSRS